ncbi:MAG: 4-diphosphocytidyl-2-C-methyl-D-erythritol kinase [Chthoniobacteraceae bacterium]|nr:4-diphosphocytidyl-2-C-methyl-D-erythritol kinase [Chthoniobacteraceae bacterium]
MEFLAPAKINLSLAIKARREDGFHEIETLMCPISVFDRLEITARDEGGLEFVCDDPSIPSDDGNLVVRAAKLFCGEIGIEPHMRIALSKQIPHGAGLGGGSSDAATVLLALNGIFETLLSRETLSAMAADLGSDIPFFIYQSAAICRGRGEQVTPVSFSQRLPLLLIKPPFGVPTPWAYKQWRDSSEIPGVPYAPQILEWGTLSNDLERPVFEKYLFLAELKRWLLKQAEVSGALMSGSGSTMMAVLKETAGGMPLGEKIAQEFGTDLWVYLCETVATELPPRRN